MRLYFGADAMATNGLRYGAGIELRENFPGSVGTNTNTGSSGYSSTETVFVRRAFTYVAGENWGLVRLGHGRRRDRHLRQRRHHRPVPDQRLRRRRPQLVSGTSRFHSSSCPRRAPSTTTRRWSICHRRSPASTSASSGRRTRRTALPRRAAPAAALELDHRRRHRYRSDLRHSDLRMSEPVVRPRHPGRRESHQPDRAGPSLPGHSRRRGHIGLCRVGA